MKFYYENTPFCSPLYGADGYRSSAPASEAWCVWSSMWAVVATLADTCRCEFKVCVGSLGTVEWTKGSQLSHTYSSFLAVLYAVSLLLLIIQGGCHRAIEAPSRRHRAIEPSSHRGLMPTARGNTAFRHRAIEAPSRHHRGLASSQHRALPSRHRGRGSGSFVVRSC